MNQQRNLILAFALSMLVLFLWGMIFPETTGRQQSTALSEAAQPVEAPSSRESEAPPAEPRQNAQIVQTETAGSLDNTASANSDMISWGNDVLNVRIDPRSGAIKAASLSRYHESKDANSEPVFVLTTSDPHPIYMSVGILNRHVEAVFHAIRQETVQGTHTLVLRADLPDGLVWERQMILENGSYVVDVRDRINGGSLQLYRQVVERNPNQKADTLYEHQGLIGFLDGSLKEFDYKDLSEGKTEKLAAVGGWTGIMNRYFIAAIIPEQTRSYRYYYKGDGITFQTGIIDDGVYDGKLATYRTQLYLGPKSIPIMKQVGVELERCVDFGWFAFIAKPLHDLLMFLYKFIPNFGVCIILIVVMIKILFYLPSKKSYESMAGMRKLQPEVARLKEMYGDDRQKMGQEMMELYKKNKVNPLGGCLPIIIQIPVFFALYKVLLISIELRQAPFVGWINDLSVQDPYFVLPVLMGISMLVQQRLSPAPPDPVQAKVMRFLPVLFTALFLFFPAGLVLYWLVNNLLSILQQWYVMKQQDVA
jgi:YidC/Oxa1 family membrane protein insertase